MCFGSELVVRDRFFPSSKICSECGLKADAMPLSVREWVCAGCGAVHDRDGNAALNIRNGPRTAGLAGNHACGDCGPGPSVMAGETAVVEAGTITERTHVFSQLG
jgi:putative transposase